MIGQEFIDIVKNCKDCKRCNEYGENHVAIEGSLGDVLIIGESPAYAEQLTEIPFCGIKELYASKCGTCINSPHCFNGLLSITPSRRVTYTNCIGYTPGNSPLPPGTKLRTAGQILDDMLGYFGFTRPHWNEPGIMVHCSNSAQCCSSPDEKPLAEQINVCSSKFLKPFLIDEIYPPERRIILGRYAWYAITGIHPKSVVRMGGQFHEGIGYLVPHPSYLQYKPSVLTEYSRMFYNVAKDLIKRMEESQ